MERYGVAVSERVSVLPPVDSYNAQYLATKRDKLGHLL